MRETPLTRPSLLLRIRDVGNHEAWEQFVEIYTPLVYGFCRSRGLQDADAADVAQESMRAVAQAIGKFEYDPQRGKFRNWLLTVVQSKLHNFLAQQQRQPTPAGETTLQFKLERDSMPEADTHGKLTTIEASSIGQPSGFAANSRNLPGRHFGARPSMSAMARKWPKHSA